VGCAIKSYLKEFKKNKKNQLTLKELVGSRCKYLITCH